MKLSSRKSFSLIFFVLFLFGYSCKSNPYNIRSATASVSSQKKIVIGPIENRDIKSLRSIASDFQDLLKFELMKNNFVLVPIQKRKNKKDFDESKDMLGSLPIQLRKAAGENWNEVYSGDRLLDREEIKNLYLEDPFDLYLQGSISIQNNDRVLDKKEYNYIFLHIYDANGNSVGMITSTFDNEIMYESELLKKVADGIILEFQKKIALKELSSRQ
ncbi:lipoprotein [Leptospira idonii]|uniref:Lipoprotein n=1 Tax=Leptospira idonii TaxID=1193500 RepID=A0A4R9LYK0_9LEPT|nr:lipoprotein [Leptospira idonii]TGN16950.1 lipoprotein [Leptospira idonii]